MNVHENRVIIVPIKITLEMNLRIIILKYSAKKIIANQPPINSTLKPETNSDSPSAKSNGDRLVSAKQVIIQTPKIKERIMMKGNEIWMDEKEKKEKELDKITEERTIINSETS